MELPTMKAVDTVEGFQTNFFARLEEDYSSKPFPFRGDPTYL
jgi:hypothetical protein